jgi:hypothetical protein
MTVWDFLTHMWDALNNSWTRIIAVSGGTLAVLAEGGFIPDKYMKGCLGAIAVLTYWRGHVTAQTYVQAKAVLATNPSLPAVPAPSKVAP